MSKEKNLIDSILQFLQNFIGLLIVPASQREIVFRVFSLTKDLSTNKTIRTDTISLILHSLHFLKKMHCCKYLIPSASLIGVLSNRRKLTLNSYNYS